jgi:polar amino acid transport system substrate-binding protein
MTTTLIFFLSLLSISAFSDETLTIATFPIPLMVESKDEGVFIALTQALAKEAGFELTIRVLPPQRTLQEFSANKIDGVFPALSVTMPGSYERSDLIYVKRDYAFTVKGNPPLETIADLSGKHVGITSGYPYAKKLTTDKSIHLDVANSDDQNVKKLLAGRVNAFVVEEKSGLKAFMNNGSHNKISYNPAQSLSEQDVFYAFQKNVRGKVLAEKISAALVVLKENGTFARIMAKAQ